ncbi:MAG TPA: amidohydrolase [Pseudolysinimonas sp.]|nr:amidohydrolase [Pseudolysinimonas sp.]
MILVRGSWVLTQGPAGELADAAVAIEGGLLTAVGPFAQLRQQHPDAEVIGDGTGVVLPGFVNAHTHLSEALATGIGSEFRLEEWGTRIIGPLGAVLTEQDAHEGTRFRAIELLLSGVTTVNDMFVHYNPDAMASLGVVTGLTSAGLRGVVSFGAEDVGGWGDVQRMLDEHDALAAAASGLIGFRYGIGTLLGQTDALLEAGIAHAASRGWAVHTHLHETREELAASLRRWGEHPIAHAERLGVLDLDVIAGHAVWVDEHEIATLAGRGVAVAHNPVANAILGSGVAPVGALRSAGIAVGIGTDGAASNDSQNMLEAVKMAALLQKVHHLDPAVVDARDVLRMATIEGARALGMDSDIGSLEPGKRADVVLFQGAVEVGVLHDPAGQLVYGASSRAVSDVLVDGRRVVRDHRCVTVDEAEQLEVVRPLVARIARAAGFTASGLSRAGLSRAAGPSAI